MSSLILLVDGEARSGLDQHVEDSCSILPWMACQQVQAVLTPAEKNHTSVHLKKSHKNKFHRLDVESKHVDVRLLQEHFGTADVTQLQGNVQPCKKKGYFKNTCLVFVFWSPHAHARTHARTVVEVFVDAVRVSCVLQQDTQDRVEVSLHCQVDGTAQVVVNIAHSRSGKKLRESEREREREGEGERERERERESE